MDNVIKVPNTGLEVTQTNGRYHIRNPQTGNFLFADRVLDPKTGKRFYRDEIIKAAIESAKVAQVKQEQPEKKLPVTALKNNTVAVCEADGYTKFFIRGTTINEVVGELYDDCYSLSDYRLIDLVTMQELKLTVEVTGE